MIRKDSEVEMKLQDYLDLVDTSESAEEIEILIERLKDKRKEIERYMDELERESQGYWELIVRLRKDLQDAFE